MNKDEIYEALAKRQDCHAETLKNPKPLDKLSHVFNDMVENAYDLDEIDMELQYTIQMLQRAHTDFLHYTEKIKR